LNTRRAAGELRGKPALMILAHVEKLTGPGAQAEAVCGDRG
jgi:hypothetical protein